MAAAPNFYQDPNRPMPAVGQNQGQPEPIYHSEFAATQYGDSPHPVFDGPSLARDAALQASLTKLEAKVDEIEGATIKLMSHAKMTEKQAGTPDGLLEVIKEAFFRYDRIQKVEDKVEKTGEKLESLIREVYKKIADLYKLMELNMPRRN